MARPNFYAKRHNVGAYRSGLEKKISEQLDKAGVSYSYETHKIAYVKPATNHHYTPDFILPNGIIIESKGLFESDDRKKHLYIKEQYPELDIRFVFFSSKSKLYKGAKSTYADWCDKYGFRYADKLIPANWLREPSVVIPSGLLILTTKGGK